MQLQTLKNDKETKTQLKERVVDLTYFVETRRGMD